MFSLFKKKDRKGGSSEDDSDVNQFGVRLDKGPSDRELEAELKGLTGMDSLPEEDLNEDAELEMLMGGRGARRPKKPAGAAADEAVLDISQLTADIDLGNEDDEAEEVDENDEELLGELLELTNPDEVEVEEPESKPEPEEHEDRSSGGDSEIVKTLKERLKMYKTAEEKAKENKESSRARRFARGIKTLESLLNKAKKGQTVSPGDIPPVIALNLKPAPPPSEVPADGNENSVTQAQDGTEIAPDDNPPVERVSFNPEPPVCVQPVENEEEVETETGKVNLEEEEEKSMIDLLYERLQMYKTAEAKAIEKGETSRARRFDRGIRKLQDLINQTTAGKEIKAEDIPPVIALNLKPAPPVVVAQEEENPTEPSIETENLVKSSEPTKPPPLKFSAVDDVDLDELEDEEEPTTALEGLQQRVRLYSKFQEEARRHGDEELAEQNERIVRVYQKAIKILKNGGYVDVLNLPNPRGCPAIPIPIYIP